MRAILAFVLLAVVLLNAALSHRHGGPHHGNRHHDKQPFSFAKITSIDLYFEGKKVDGITQSTERKEKILNQFVQQNFGLQQQAHEDDKEVDDEEDDIKLPVSTDLFSRAKANILFVMKSSKGENFGASRLLQKWAASFKSSSVHMINAAQDKLFGKLPEAAQLLSRVNDDLVDVTTTEKFFTYKQSSSSSAQAQLEEELEAVVAVFGKLEAAKKDLLTPSFYVFSLADVMEKMTTQEDRAKATATVAAFMDKFFQENTQALGEVIQDVKQEEAKHHRFAGHRRLLAVEAQLQANKTVNYNETIAKTMAIGDYQTQVWTWIMLIILLFSALYLMNSIEYSRDAMIYHVKDDDVEVASK